LFTVCFIYHFWSFPLVDRKLEDDISSSKADLAKIKEHAQSAEKIVSKVKEFQEKVSKKAADLK
jgi:proteasome assembly chaperone (PAC2) family protein